MEPPRRKLVVAAHPTLFGLTSEPSHLCECQRTLHERSETIAQTSRRIPETVPRVLFSRGGGESPGALDTHSLDINFISGWDR